MTTKKKSGTPALVDLAVRFPWERQEQEAPALYAVFVRYLESSPRSIRRAIGAAGGKTPRLIPGHVSRASRSWRWAERAAAFDEHVAAQERAAFERLRKKTRDARLGRLASLALQVKDAVPRMRLAAAEPAVVLKALEVLAREEREELLDTAEDRRTRPETSTPLPDLDRVLLDAPEPEPRPEPQIERIQ